MHAVGRIRDPGPVETGRRVLREQRSAGRQHAPGRGAGVQAAGIRRRPGAVDHGPGGSRHIGGHVWSGHRALRVHGARAAGGRGHVPAAHERVADLRGNGRTRPAERLCEARAAGLPPSLPHARSRGRRGRTRRDAAHGGKGRGAAMHADRGVRDQEPVATGRRVLRQRQSAARQRAAGRCAGVQAAGVRLHPRPCPVDRDQCGGQGVRGHVRFRHGKPRVHGSRAARGRGALTAARSVNALLRTAFRALVRAHRRSEPGAIRVPAAVLDLRPGDAVPHAQARQAVEEVSEKVSVVHLQDDLRLLLFQQSTCGAGHDKYFQAGIFRISRYRIHAYGTSVYRTVPV